MLLDLIAITASAAVLVLSLGVIVHMFAAHWRQIRTALNAEIALGPDPIPPVRLVRARPVRSGCQARAQRLPLAA